MAIQIVSNSVVFQKLSEVRLLFKESSRGYGWIKRPNDVFGGRSALNIMLGGQLTDLMRVRRYLDAQRGAW